MKTRTPMFHHLKGGKFHSAIASTFGVDFAAWENVALPSLHSSGCRNVMLLADAGMMTQAMNGASVLPQKAGRSYTANSISAPRVFHPKLTLLAGRDTARLVVASANLTSPGLAGNLEIAGVINASPELPGETQIVAGALSFLRSHLVSHGDVIGHQLELLNKRTGWLIRSERAVGPVLLSDGSAAQLLCSDDDEGISTRFARNVGTERVKRLVVVSPYWDSDLAALRSLIEVLKPEQTVLLVDVTRRLFPTHAFARLDYVHVVDISHETRSSFVHAKLFLAETDEADHVIYGSPNCTVAALGTAQMKGLNVEACLYRRLPRGSVAAELELTEVLAGPPVPVDRLPTQELRGGKLELEAQAAAKSGVFEVKGDILHWHTGGRSVSAQTAVELFDVAKGISPSKLEPLGELTDAVRRFRVVGELPAFARLRYPDGTYSALACVTVAEQIYALAREVRGKDAEKAVDRLTGSNEVGVFMLEALQALALAEDELGAGQSGATGSAKRAPEEPNASTEEKPYKTLTYEAFVSGSKARTGAAVEAPGVFAGGGLWHVQQLLNRSIGMATRHSENPDDDAEESDIRRLFKRGDETANPEGELNTPNSSQPDNEDDEPDPRKEAEKRERYAAETLGSVQRHVKYLWELKKKQEASTVDVLRLRVVLMLIASAATGKSLTEMHAEHEANPRSRLVLPIAGIDCWPRLMLTQLGLFFGTNAPIIRSLRIVCRDTDMPSDILECWATNVWALHASEIAVRRYGEREDMRDLGVRLLVLPQQLYHGLGLEAEQFRRDSFAGTYDCLVNHFGHQLDTDPAEMWVLHESWIKS